jgi:hypothetical protein
MPDENLSSFGRDSAAVSPPPFTLFHHGLRRQLARSRGPVTAPKESAMNDATNDSHHTSATSPQRGVGCGRHSKNCIRAPRLRRRETKQRVRAVYQRFFGDLRPEEDALRAIRVRNLCPCEFSWDEVCLWRIIYDACDDPSPLVRQEALHVIVDAWERGMPFGRGMRYVLRAQNDPFPEVRRYAGELVRMVIPVQRASQKRAQAKREEWRLRREQEDV